MTTNGINQTPTPSESIAVTDPIDIEIKNAEHCQIDCIAFAVAAVLSTTLLTWIFAQAYVTTDLLYNRCDVIHLPEKVSLSVASFVTTSSILVYSGYSFVKAGKAPSFIDACHIAPLLTLPILYSITTPIALVRIIDC